MLFFKSGDSTFINSCEASADWQGLAPYQAFVNKLSNETNPVWFGGISTIEINSKKDPNKRIMHNQISEGFTEYISRLVMAEIGEHVKNPKRYADRVYMAERVSCTRGREETIYTYLTAANELITELEGRNGKNNGIDMLHQMSSLINSKNSLAQIIQRNWQANAPGIQDLEDKFDDLWKNKINDGDEANKVQCLVNMIMQKSNPYSRKRLWRFNKNTKFCCKFWKKI